MFKVLSKVKEMERAGKNIIHFEIGDPDFSTPKTIINAACTALQNNETHYTDSMGLRDFRETICQATLHSRGFLPTLNQVLVAPGANILIYYAVACLTDPGDEVIVPDPGFPTYYSVLNFCGAKAIPVPLKEENAFRMNPKDVEAAITPKTRLIILNSPQNPTGSLMTPEEIEAIAELAKKYNIYIFSDEVYVRMCFDPEIPFKSPSFLDQCNERTIVANGFSKAFAMTGWRLGVAIGPEPVIEKMSLLLQTTSSCVSPFIQRAGIEAISGDQSDVQFMCATYKKRRDLLVDGLNAIPGITCLKPGGAMYVFPNIKDTGLTSQAFADFCLEEAGIALLPGTNFGDYGEGYVRLCYAISEDQIKEGLRRLDAAIRRRNS